MTKRKKAKLLFVQSLIGGEAEAELEMPTLSAQTSFFSPSRHHSHSWPSRSHHLKSPLTAIDFTYSITMFASQY